MTKSPSFEKAEAFADLPYCRLRRQFDLNGMHKPGDMILGGLFEVHYTSVFPDLTFTSEPNQLVCQGFDLAGFRHAMTMAFAIDEINRNISLLPNVTLGYSLYDNCATLVIGFSAALSMVSGQQEQFLQQEKCLGTPPVLGIVGDSFSTFSIATSDVIGLFKLPIVSYFATCSCLSDRQRFPSFFRTIPSDAFQVRAVIQILKHFRWSWVGLLVSDDDYGLHVARSFQSDLTRSGGGCLAYLEILPWGYNPGELTQVVEVMKKSTARVVIVFAHQIHMIQLMEEVVKQNLTGLQWIASEAWTAAAMLQTTELMPYLGGTLGIAIRRGEIPGLRDFLLGLHPDLHEISNRNSLINYRVRQFWEYTFQCRFAPAPTGWVEGGGLLCTGEEELGRVQTEFLDVSNLRPEYNIYKAVYALAHALDEMLHCVPGRGPFDEHRCATLESLKPWQLMHYLQQVNFTTAFGDEVSFDENGDALPIYDIMNWLWLPDGRTKVQNVGEVKGSSFRDATVSLQHELSSRDPENSMECTSCPEDFWSSPQRDHCVPKKTEFLSYHEPLGICLTAASLLGTVISAVVLGIFIHHRSTPVVRANNSELSFLLLVSLKLCFLCSLLFIGRPRLWTCQLRHAAFGISFVLCVSCILVKTMVVLAVFRASKPGGGATLKWFGAVQQRGTVLVWVAFVPAYINSPGKYADAVEVFAILASSFGLLVRAMIQILKHFGWTWVGLLVSDDDYGLHVARSFQSDLAQSGQGCLAYLEVVRQKVTGLQWLASEAWTGAAVLQTPDFMPYLNGTLGIAIRRGEITGLRDFLLRIRPGQSSNNTSYDMVQQFWEYSFQCKFGASGSAEACTGDENIQQVDAEFLDVSNLRPEYNIYKAVYALAHALDDMLQCEPGRGPFSGGSCADIDKLEPWQLFKLEQQGPELGFDLISLMWYCAFAVRALSTTCVNFTTTFGDQVSFDENGDVLPIYDIVNWQWLPNGRTQVQNVGEVKRSPSRGEELQIHEDKIFWNFESNKLPHSVCSESCPPGTRMSTKKGQPVCCFDCLPCSEGEISNTTDSMECTSCPEDFWSSPQRDHCVPKKTEFLSYHEPLGICLTAASLLGTVISAVVLGIFIHHRTVFPLSLLFIGRPRLWTCQLRHAAFGISFVLCVSCILVKTMVVLAVFRASKPGGGATLKWFGAVQQRGTVLVWVAFVPAYINSPGKYADAVEVFAILASSFGLLEINKNPDLLPNLTLGYRLYDNCGALVVGFSGALALASGQEEAFALQGLCWEPTGPGDRGTIPSDAFQVRAMIQILKHFGWTWVGLLVSDDDYGLHVARSFQSDLAQSGQGCLAYLEVLPWDGDLSENRRIVHVIKESTARVLMMFAHEFHMIHLMEEVVRQKVTGLQWLASEAMTAAAVLQTPDFMPYLNGTLGIAIRRGEITGLRDFLLRIRPGQSSNNTSYDMVQQFWEYSFQCKFGASGSAEACTGDENIQQVDAEFLDVSNLRPEYNIYKAVYALAHALDDMLQCEPGRGPFSGGSCADIHKLEPWQFVHYLQHVNFTTTFGDQVSFDENGDVLPIYDIVNWLWLPNGRTEVQNVGEVKRSPSRGEELQIHEDKIFWNFESNKPPQSVCSESCPPGTRMSRKKGQPVCCFDCLPCSEGEISNITAPSDHCVPKKTEFLSYHEPLGICLTAASLLGTVISAVVLGIFIHHRSTPVVRANNSELSFLLLVSLKLCFLCFSAVHRSVVQAVDGLQARGGATLKWFGAVQQRGTVLVWVAFVPAYINSPGKYADAVEVFAILASSFGLLSDLAQSGQGCLAYLEVLPWDGDLSENRRIVHVIKESAARVLMMFAHEFHMINLMEEVVRQKVTGLQWLASEAMTAAAVLQTPDFMPYLNGTLGIAIRRGSAEACTGDENIQQVDAEFLDVSNLRPEYNIYKAVYALAYALDDMLQCEPGRGPFSGGSCADIHKLEPWQFVHYLQHVNFTTTFGDQVSFDENGDVLPIYDIVNWQWLPNGRTEVQNVGEVKRSPSRGEELQIHEDKIFWNFESNKPPQSVCSESCPPGTRMSRKKGQPVCCFDCLPCSEGEISNTTDSMECTSCPEDFWSSPQRVHCVPKKTEFLSYHEPLGICLTAASLLGTVISAVVLGIFIHHRSTPVVRANNSELSFLLLVSLKLCFLCSLLFIGRPRLWTCQLRHAAFGISFVLCVSCILVKPWWSWLSSGPPSQEGAPL
ncbi:Extracellular calcium-sensing receptor [Takifugu flavidus]|uniref:Extracellular calcium-sensing receptor n=1 Tax=Takifugu flavidus TaxID=433684 RepID=A0A5C6PEM2_9TELE|nr:Extracellular calcium-sensing receptor [Takifugu flavidus]